MVFSYHSTIHTPLVRTIQKQRKGFLLLMGCFFFSFLLQAQVVSGVLRMADSLVVQGEKNDAIALYERALYFDNAGESIQHLPNLADLYFQTGDYSKALQTYLLAARNTIASDSVRAELPLKILSCYYFSSDFEMMQEELLLMDTGTYEARYNYHLLNALYCFRSRKFDAAEKEFQIILNESYHAPASEIFKKVRKTNARNVRHARIMSIIIPGLGQAAWGDWKNGINSFLLTGGLATVGIFMALNAGFFDAALLVGPWFQRYYLGGIKRSVLIAEHRKQEKILHGLDEVLKLCNQHPKQ